MLDVLVSQEANGLAASSPGEIEVETIRGHFFELDLFFTESGQGPVSGTLQFGLERITLEPDHACHLADRVRSAIDNAVAGTIVHSSGHITEGH